MGLDQYLKKRTYVRNWDHQGPEERHAITITKGGKPTQIKPERIFEIVELIGYWRKANQIHAWFVKNVQKNVDDCGEYRVSIEQLRELLKNCQSIIADPDVAIELLPTESGFFFGSTNYDEGYLQDLNDTVKILEEALSDPDGDYYYDSSW